MAALVLAALVAVRADSAGEPARHSAAAVSVSGLFPAFASGERRYVSRCGVEGRAIAVRARRGATVSVAGGPPRSGAFRVDPPVGPGEDFEISVDAGGRRSYQVRCLPAGFPQWHFESRHRVAPAYFTVAFRDPKTDRPWVIVFDDRGVPRWWYEPPTQALWAQVLTDGELTMARSFGDGYGVDPRMAEEVRSLDGQLVRVLRTRGTITDGHELRETAGGDFFVDSYEPAGGVDLARFGGPARASAVFAEVQEVDSSGNVVWSWNSRPEIGLGETGRWWHNVLSNGKSSGRRGPTFDPVHINSIEPRGRSEVVVSMRHTDAIYGIDRADGSIAWKLGGTRTPESLRILGDPATKVFGGQHDARIGPGGVLSVFDNGKDRPRRPRVAFYRLETDRGVARYLGQLNDPRVARSHCCGSARPFVGGWLVSWGDNPLVSGFDARDRLAFRLGLPTSSYRAVPAPPGSIDEAALDRGMERMEPAAPGDSLASRRPSPAG